MRFEELISIAGDDPVFETGVLLAGDVDPADIRRQISRWTRLGKIVQMRRGLYLLAPPFRKVDPHPFLLANRVHQPSYVSLHSALAHYGLIPEHVPVVSSVTSTRPGSRATASGGYRYRHVRAGMFRGYEELEIVPGQKAFVATPEKALVDLVYLTPRGETRPSLEGLRLQHLERLDPARLEAEVALAGGDKLRRALAVVTALAAGEAREYQRL